jgi:hypothetical protein
MKRKHIQLLEAIISGTYPDTGGIAGDDDAPTGNILMGRKYKKVKVNTPIGSYTMSVPEDEWSWGEFEHAKGMEVQDNYHETLGEPGPYRDRMWRHSPVVGTPGDPMGLDREDMRTGEEESMPAYVANVVKHEEPAELQKKNLPDIVFKIDRSLQQDVETKDKSVES